MWNYYRASNLYWLWKAHEGEGNPADAERYHRLWDSYSRELTKSLGEQTVAFLLQLCDEALVKTWAAIDPSKIDDVLLPSPAPLLSFAAVGRNDPCPCGGGKKFKRCHGG